MKTIVKVIYPLVLLFLLAGCAGPLHKAAAKGDIQTLKRMLDDGADVNDSAIDPITGPATLLDRATFNCQVEAARLLLERGADVKKDSLHLAVLVGCKSVAKLLIDAGAEPDAVDGQGYTPLARAAQKGQKALVGLLIESGADTDRAIGYLISEKQHSAAQLIELAVKSISDGKTQIAAKQDSLSPAIKSDIDELPEVKAKPNKNAYAIVIGIENYRQKLPAADFAAKDAQAVAGYLTKVLGYPEENVVTMMNDRAALGDLAKYFEKWLANNVEKDSTVFIYFSGHGAPNPKTGDAYLVPYDGDPSFIDQTGYSLKRMYDALGKLKAKEIIVALDSCFSGAGGRSVIAKGARPLVMNLQSTMVVPVNLTVLSASSGDQISSTYDQKGHGLFTYFLLKGIKNKDVVNSDGSLAIKDLFDYIKPQVERIARKHYNNEQIPQLIGGK